MLVMPPQAAGSGPVSLFWKSQRVLSCDRDDHWGGSGPLSALPLGGAYVCVFFWGGCQQTGEPQGVELREG